MTRKIAALTLAVTLGLAASAQAGRGPRLSGFGDDDPAHQLIAQIAAKMLHDGLQLTAAQKTDLARIIREHQTDIEAFRSQRSEGKEQMVQALTAARDELYRTGAISPVAREGVVAAHKARRPGHAAEGDGDADVLMQKKPKIGADLDGVLTPQQLEYVETFNPMRELGFDREGRHGGRKDARGGDGKGGPGHRLERLRDLSDEEYAQKRQEIVERFGENLRERGEAEAEVADRTQKLGAKLDLLRSGSDADLDAMKETFDLPRVLDQGRGAAMKARHHEKGRKALLLSPEFLALLEGRDPLSAAK